MLTKRQKQALLCIKDYIDEHGIPPSYDEIQQEMGLKSKASIYQLINALEDRKFIKRLRHKARALEILRLPSGHGYSPQIVRHSAVQTSVANDMQCVQLDLMGTIAAGSPIEAILNIKDTILIPASMTSGFGEHFVLEVSGDSMINAGILDGDFVIIRRQNIADFGDIIVAFVRGETATLKRIRKGDNDIVLEAENPSIPNQNYGHDEIEIQGKLVGMYRHC